jgi:hypothetical protein
MLAPDRPIADRPIAKTPGDPNWLLAIVYRLFGRSLRRLAIFPLAPRSEVFLGRLPHAMVD